MIHEAEPNKQQAKSEAVHKAANNLDQAMVTRAQADTSLDRLIAEAMHGKEVLDQARVAAEQQTDGVKAESLEALQQARVPRSKAEIYLEKLRSEVSQQSEEVTSQARLVSGQES